MAEEISTFLKEVDEALRIDNAEQFWRRYSIYIIGFCVALVLGTASVEYWKYYSAERDGKQTGIILHADALVEEQKFSDAVTTLGNAEKGGHALADIARLHQAQIWIKAGAPDKAQAVYEELAGDSKADQASRDFAALEANIIADNRHAKTTVSLPVAPSVFAPQAQELQAVRLLDAGKTKEAQAILKPLSEDAATSTTIRSQAMELLETLAENSK